MPLLEGASNFSISGCARLYEIHGDAVINQSTLDTSELKKIQSIVNLPRAQASRKDYETKKKSGPCFPGTRKAILQEMMDWVINPGDSRMYALSGLAGIGKSTVAYTVAAEADKLDILGASFFFSRDEADRRTAKKFFTTIAYQLCLFNEEFAQAIAGALVTEPGSTATTGSPKLEEQLETLILDPLRAIVTPNTPQTLIVIDALDECDDEDVPSVLMGLRQLVQAFPSFKVILTTRPQPILDNDLTRQGGHKIFHLQDIEDKVVNEDIRLYLKHSLSLEQVRAQLRDPSEQWCVSDGEIEILVQVTGKLFIIAATIVRFILDKTWSDPADKMEELLRAFAQNCTPFDNLHEFYNIILRRAVPADCRDKRVAERYQAVVGTIMLTPVSLSVNTIAALTGVKEKQVFVVLRQLQSIISVGSDNIPVIYHKSFVDYITNSTRCKDVCLLIKPEMCHTWIAIRCFQLMQQHLKYNILDFSKPAQYMTNEDGLAKDGITNEQLEEKIPEHLRYACVYWANHLKVANIDNTDLVKELERFADQRMLYWFEVLSLIGKFDVAYRAILVTLKVSKSMSSDLRQLLSDSLRFIGKFYEITRQSALHTYHSALVFTPSDSLLYRCYINLATFHIIGGPNKWDPLVATVNHGDWVNRNVQFSLDSTMFVSWSKSVLKIWDAVTGTPISTIRGSCFAISNDFSTVASTEGNTIALYNVNGGKRGTTITTQAKIKQLAISPKTIAAGLSDGTLYLWDSRNDELMPVGCFNDYKDHYLEFSATSARLAYWSTKDIIKLRDGIDGRLIADLDCESSDDLCFAFSRDGDRIATLSEFKLKLWSCEGELVGIVKDDENYGLAISANGSLLATQNSGEVKLWGVNSGNFLPLIGVLDLGRTNSIAFSPDDTLAIGTREDIKLYNVKTHSLISTLSFRYCSYLAFSPDCSRLVGVASHGTTYLLDICNLETLNSLSNEKPSDKTTALALSRDCSRLACGYGDGVVELWEILGGLTKQLIITHRPHTKGITILQFSPDGRQFASASASEEGAIKLWEGKDGALFGTLRHHMGQLDAIEVSNMVLAAAGDEGIVLWDSITLDHIHTFWGNFSRPLSLSANDALLAAVTGDIGFQQVIVFDTTQHTSIATFDVPWNRWRESGIIHGMAFPSDNSQLAIQLKIYHHSIDGMGISHDHDDFHAFNLLVDKPVPRQLTFKDISQFLNVPRWNGVPVWPHAEPFGQCTLQAFFSQHDDPVTVLWIPHEFYVEMVLGEGSFHDCVGLYRREYSHVATARRSHRMIIAIL